MKLSAIRDVLAPHAWEEYGYRFKAPRHWYVSATNPAPFAFSYSPQALRLVQAGVPKGGAHLSIVEDKETYNVGSIDAWVKADTKRSGFSSIRTLERQINPLIAKAVEVVSYEDNGDSYREVVTHTTTVYFEFDGHLYAAMLMFNANDPKARHYEKCLEDVLASFTKVPVSAGTTPR